MIRYTEKGPKLHEAIRRAGWSLKQINGEMVASDAQGRATPEAEAAVQAIIDAFDPLPDHKADKIEAIKAEGLARIHDTFPAITSFDQLDLIHDLYLSILPAARTSPTARWQRMVNIWQAGQAAITQVRNATTQAQVDAVTPAWPA